MVAICPGFPWTALISNILSHRQTLCQIIYPDFWFQKYGHHMANASTSVAKKAPIHPLAKALPSSPGRRGCLSGPPLSLLPCLHSSTFLPVSYLGRGLSKSKDNICFISMFPVHVLNKLEASFQGSMTLCSRNLSEKFGGYLFKLKSLSKSLLNRTWETRLKKEILLLLFFLSFPFLFFPPNNSFRPFKRSELADVICQKELRLGSRSSGYVGFSSPGASNRRIRRENPHFKSVRNSESRSCSHRILYR